MHHEELAQKCLGGEDRAVKAEASPPHSKETPAGWWRALVILGSGDVGLAGGGGGSGRVGQNGE